MSCMTLIADLSGTCKRCERLGCRTETHESTLWSADSGLIRGGRAKATLECDAATVDRILGNGLGGRSAIAQGMAAMKQRTKVVA